MLHFKDIIIVIFKSLKLKIRTTFAKLFKFVEVENLYLLKNIKIPSSWFFCIFNSKMSILGGKYFLNFCLLTSFLFFLGSKSPIFRLRSTTRSRHSGARVKVTSYFTNYNLKCPKVESFVLWILEARIDLYLLQID